jgi:hypothetical protein
VIAGMTVAAAHASAAGINTHTGTVIGACVLAWALWRWAGGHGGGHGGGARRGGGRRGGGRGRGRR